MNIEAPRDRDLKQLTDGQVADTVGSSLDHFIGSWSEAETEEIDRALKHFEAIDEAMWE